MSDVKVTCTWVRGSSAKKTLKNGRPGICREKNCPGVFDRLPECESFMLPIGGPDRLKTVEAVYRLAKNGIDISSVENDLRNLFGSADPEVVIMAARALFRHYHNVGNQSLRSDLVRSSNPDIRKGIKEELGDLIRG